MKDLFSCSIKKPFGTEKCTKCESFLFLSIHPLNTENQLMPSGNNMSEKKLSYALHMCDNNKERVLLLLLKSVFFFL